ncbi:MAG: hypothetical protein ACFFCS_14695 [Candidatus Hodarchaeota archaeon]
MVKLMEFNIDEMFRMFKENLDIEKDGEGVLIRFKIPPPDFDPTMFKGLVEKMMAMRDPSGENEDEYNVRVDVLEDGTGFKIIPENPQDIDKIFDSLQKLFDPSFFQEVVNAFMQYMGGGMLDDDNNMDNEPRDPPDQYYM